MAETFYSILTSIGKAKIANAAGLGTKIDFVKMKVGDGNGSYYNPTESQTDLVHTVWQGNINQVAIDEDNPNWINIEVLIPPSDGGFFIREYGVFDSDGNMLAIAKCAETYKPLPSDGGTKEITMKMVLAISNTSSVTLKIDPTVIFAKKSEVEIVQNQVNSIKSEVENARGTYENLEARLDHGDSQLSKKANNTDVILNNNTKDIYLGSFFDNSVDRRSYLYTSMDGKDFTRISDTPVGLVNRGDTGIIYKNNKFYLLADYNNTSDKCNFTISTSTNLYDWVETKIKLSDYSDDNFRVYGSDWFLDDNGKIYIVYSRQEGYMPNGVSLNFRPRIVEVTDLENLQFGTPQVLNISNYNRIDPTMIKNNGIYYLFVKKELDEDTLINGTISIWTSTDLTNWTKQTDAISSLAQYKFEGPCVCNVDGLWYLYVDNWDGSLNGYMHYCTSTDLINWSTPVQIKSTTPLRHGSVFKIDNLLGKKVINNLFTQKLLSDGVVPLFTHNKYVNGINITSSLANKYIELFNITMPNIYTAFNIKFKISDTQNMFNNSEFILCGSSLGTVDILNNCTFKEVNSFKSSLVNNLVVISQNGVHRVFLKIGTIVGSTMTLSVLDFEANKSTSLVITNGNAVDTLPSGTQITPTANNDISNAINTLTGKLRLSKTCQTLATTNTTVSFYGVNGIVKIQGHANGYSEVSMIDYNLMLLNGNIGLVKLDTNGATISVALNSYSNGVYNITITAPAAYSIFDLTLPVGGYFIN